MRIYLSGNLIRFTEYHREVEVEAESVYDGLLALIRRYPELEPVLLDANREARALHRLFVDGEQVSAAALRDPVRPDASVSILTAIAGG